MKVWVLIQEFFFGGLCILWDPSRVSLTNFQETRNSLSANFKVVGFPIYGLITNVYGPQKAGDKSSFFKYLINLGDLNPSVHWVFGGDFNLVTSLEEKKGGGRCLEEQCNIFKDTIDDLGIVDITLGEGWFT